MGNRAAGLRVTFGIFWSEFSDGRVPWEQSSLGIVTGAKAENYCAAADVGGLNPSFSALTTRIIDCSYRFKWRIFEHTQDLEAYRMWQERRPGNFTK
jgi:hypothetical protein